LTGADTEPSPERGELRHVIIRSEREHLASQRMSADLDAGQAIVVPVRADSFFVVYRREGEEGGSRRCKAQPFYAQRDEKRRTPVVPTSQPT